MSNYWGLNVEQVKQLSTELVQAASDVDAIKSKLTGKLDSVEWNGPDATAFRSDWSGQHVTALQTVITALNEAGAKAQANALAQEATSNAS